jgi:hypothetical protein
MAGKEPYRKEKKNGFKVHQDHFICEKCKESFVCCAGYRGTICANCASGYKPVYVGLEPTI